MFNPAGEVAGREIKMAMFCEMCQEIHEADDCPATELDLARESVISAAKAYFHGTGNLAGSVSVLRLHEAVKHLEELEKP